MNRLSAGLISAILLGCSARAEAPHDLFTLALDRIDSVYLWRNTLDPVDAFSAAGRQLEQEVEWAIVRQDGPTLTLRRGDGDVLGQVTVETWDGLAEGLRDLESLTYSADPDLRGELDLQVVLLKGAADALDRHSRILHGRKLKSFDKRLKGTISGIGARIGSDEHQIIIKQIYPDTPADRSGLKAGDQVLRIDDVSTVGMNVRDAVDRITGDRGSSLSLQISRDVEGVARERTFELVREEIQIPNLDWRALEAGPGYISIDHFSEQTVRLLQRALQELEDQGALSQGLVLDLRGNTGGSMIQSARSADQFLAKGELVKTVGRDGKPVSGLVSSIKAIDEGDEPDIPVVILQDRRTASGSEIVAGALRELDRTVLLGTTSYGKGTVQKVYTLRPDTRMKLTVAEYLLPGELSIHDVGLSPDLPVGSLRFDGDGVSMEGASLQRDGSTPLLYVDERDGWREAAAPDSRGDVLLEIATRLLARSTATDRATMLSDLAALRLDLQSEEEALLIETFQARGLDWSAGQGIPEDPEIAVDLSLAAPAASGGEVEILAKVTNLGVEPLHRVIVHLASVDSAWDDVVMPVGFLAPGATAEGRRRIEISAGRHARESEIAIEVELDGRAPLLQDPMLLGYSGDPDPPLALTIALSPDGDPRTARLQVENLGDAPLEDLRLRFEHPEDISVELTEYDTRIDALAPGATATATLGLRVLEDAPEALPLQVIAEADGYYKIVDWPLELSAAGDETHLQAPTIAPLDLPTRAPTGARTLRFTVRDDRAVDHAVIWGADGKLAYASGEGDALTVEAEVELEPGKNAFTVIATDDQGVVRRETWYLHGEDAAAADATPDP